ncbi:MAG: gliding motility-associated C-terminal domain-containing protein [Crocinitomicaceae bacterium]
MKLVLAITILIFSCLSYSQPVNDNCSNATYLCPNTPVNATNIGATAQTCAGCEDTQLFACLIANNSIWFKFFTNDVGGIANVTLDNIVYNDVALGRAEDIEIAVYEMGTPCVPSTYSEVINCGNTHNTNAATTFSISTNNLNPNTMYYIIVDGIDFGAGVTAPGEATFDITVSGPSVIRPTPSIALTTLTTNICKGDLVTLTATRSSDCILDSTFNWTQNGTVIAVTSVDTFQTNLINDGDYIGVYTVCDSVCGGTSPNDSILFSVLELTLDAGVSQTILDGESTNLNGSTNSTNYTVSWTPDITLNNSSIINPVASPNSTTTYFMTITDTVNGCSDTDSVTITVDPQLKIPDTFTPNGDGVNDTWEIVTADQYPNCEIIIYNRWGTVVFRSNGYPQSKWWNGTSKNGNELSPGAYFYYIDFKDPAHPDPYRGTINLVR